jgi:hypothetical protein
LNDLPTQRENAKMKAIVLGLAALLTADPGLRKHPVIPIGRSG